jgi:hypothetical protein
MDLTVSQEAYCSEPLGLGQVHAPEHRRDPVLERDPVGRPEYLRSQFVLVVAHHPVPPLLHAVQRSGEVYDGAAFRCANDRERKCNQG